MGIIWHEYSAEHRFFEVLFLQSRKRARELTRAPLQVLWSFSVWLEAVAILPQVAVMQSEGECENVNSHYVAALGSYRAFYILNWIYRKFTDGYWHPIVVVGGILQTALYCDFFYYYITAKAKVSPDHAPLWLVHIVAVPACRSHVLSDCAIALQGGIAEPVKVQVDAGVV